MSDNKSFTFTVENDDDKSKFKSITIGSKKPAKKKSTKNEEKKGGNKKEYTRKPLEQSEINDLLKDYNEESITNINERDHLRYYSAVRKKGDPKNIQMDEEGNPLITFKKGGFLMSKQSVNINDEGIPVGWVRLYSNPFYTNGTTWTCCVDEYTRFFKKKGENNDEVTELKREVEMLKGKIERRDAKIRELKRLLTVNNVNLV